MHCLNKRKFAGFHSEWRGERQGEGKMRPRLVVWVWALAGFSVILCMGCGMSQTKLQEALDQHAVELTERVRALEEKLEDREEQIDTLLMEMADQEEQIHQAARYIDEQAERFARSVEAVRGLPLPAAVPDMETKAALPARQTMTPRTDASASKSIEVFDVVAYRSAFFADKYGNVLLTPALRLSLRNRTRNPLRLHIQARRVGLHDPFGVHVVDLQPGTRAMPLRIPYDPGHDLIVRIDQQTMHYRLLPE